MAKYTFTKEEAPKIFDAFFDSLPEGALESYFKQALGIDDEEDKKATKEDSK